MDDNQIIYILNVFNQYEHCFTLRRGKRRRRKRNQERKNKEKVIHSPANSNLPGESITREKERVLLFLNRRKTSLFYKKQYQGRKSKGKGITSKKILKKKNLFEIFLSEVIPREEAHSLRQEGKALTCRKLCFP